jgi:hypothetical protein
MFKKFFGPRIVTADRPAFADTVVERRVEPRPWRDSECAQDNDAGLLDSDPNFIIINAAFPHIGKKLKVYWGCQEFVSYMRNLLHDTRGNTRKGFPMEVLLALQNISDGHGLSYPHILPKDKLWLPIQRR